MAEIVNLRQVRKQRARAEKRVEASANAAKFGQSRAERQLHQAQAERAEALHAGHRRSPQAQVPGAGEGPDTAPEASSPASPETNPATTAPPLLLRRATPGDAPALAALARRGLAGLDHDDHPPAQIQRLAAQLDESAMAEQIAHSLTLVAEAPSGALVGMGGMRLQGDCAEICNLIIHPDHQRQGLGRRLMAALAEAGRVAGAGQMSLSSALGALPFFRALGFRVSGETDLPGALPGEGGAPFVRMARPMGPACALAQPIMAAEPIVAEQPVSAQDR